jgi:YHS domain-containing protein
MMRQIGKQILTITAWAFLALGAHGQAPATIVTDPLTGVAIDGYDPVSYFISPEPMPGKPDFELSWGGASWYFTSAANRDVFARNPTSYAPQFGGHCVTSLSRGYLSDGKPRLFAIEGLKLYFFYSTANKEAFLLSRSATVAKAAENWTRLADGVPETSQEAVSSEPPAETSESADPAANVEPSGAHDNVPTH